MSNEIIKSGSPFYCDAYHFTMAQAWFLSGNHNKIKTSEGFFRKNPFEGGYVLNAGLGEFLEWVDNWKITDRHIEALRKKKDEDGNPRFSERFLEFLKDQRLIVDIKAVPEGEVVFPHEPVISVTGPCWQVDMVESAFLNCFNGQSLIATKAARMVRAAGIDGIERPLLEFGLRREQGTASMSPTRAAFIGGCAGTSFMEAAEYYNIPDMGTMAHSYVMSYDDEKEAFKDFMKANPKNSIVLPDTYDTRQGIKNAIQASKEVGVPLKGLRIDSGDLAYWYFEAKKMLKDNWMPNTKMVASNDLDEYLIEDLIMVQNAKYDIWAAGTKLVTAYDCPALGGVFKTKAIDGKDKMKIAEGKSTIPGATDVIRIVKNGKYEGDIIVKQGEEWIKEGKLDKIIQSYNIGSDVIKNIEFEDGIEAYSLLKTMVVDGKVVSQDKDYSLQQIQKTAKENLAKLDDSYKRFRNPHKYGVGLEKGLLETQKAIIVAYQKTQGR